MGPDSKFKLDKKILVYKIEGRTILIGNGNVNLTYNGIINHENVWELISSTTL
jgi:hypothetical protein